MKLFGIETEKILSFCAIIISIGTFGSILYQNSLYKRQQYASVLPYLEIWHRNTPDVFAVQIVNTGVGPAFIEKIEILYGDSIYEGDLPNFLLEKRAHLVKKLYHSNTPKGIIIPAGKTIETIMVEFDSTRIANIKKAYKDINLRITYTSIYGEKWVKTKDEVIPQKID
ncbi:MAG: hypothetical protein RBS81_10420 [Tenuifilaceae bacterium]|jgi:hypothetical protein|nr:hypothetical protein [Tenuifilaceae bacterium]